MSGSERRIDTPNGPVWVYTPNGYDPSRAGTCVYVHGFYTNVDQAWRDHGLPRKFGMSRQNALFIAVEGPAAPKQPVRWASLEALFDEVEKQLPVKCRGPGPVGAMAHSAGYKTVAQWLGDDRLVHITLLDALYGYVEDYGVWMRTQGKTTNLLTTMEGGTLSNCEDLVMGLKGVEPCAGVPATYEAFTIDQRHAKTLYLKTRLQHMELVEKDAVIPVLLRRSPWELIS